ncbi:helix-turn-helix and ligand-binding sensor domain-containing protein [Zobellia barbeyronii]|uniref:Two component regulator three y domain-containing protein n=1 Tax=Zobellia barbeyronii TaxID=2748009 RepID=A0ABS5WJS1_9FLAO|nr:triple tyrosine motif-containing protein [Zobellia barbeyronii]MBT2163527.1 two component regulator three y domain-containing protein [Zobellia barbeyronii]
MVLRPFNLFFLLFSIGLFSQELPPIQNYSPVDYGAQNQNWSLSQSDDKYIYAANNDGLLEFNGINWKLYPSPNGSTLRAVKAARGLVYTGCYMEFGFWKQNSYGELFYNSISNKLPVELLEDEEFWNIVTFDDWILFQSLERIYIYNVSDSSVKVIETKTSRAKIFNINGAIYFHSIVKGLFKIENGEKALVSNHPLLKKFVVSGIFSIDNRTILVTEKGDFYFLENEDLVPWHNPLKEQSNAVNVYSSIQLADGSIALGTISHGIYLISKKGDVITNIDQENGLNNNTVLSILEDVEHNLWLALDNGISIINIDSPFNEYIDRNGKLGVVYASAMFKDYFYLGTNQGLFYKRINAKGDFELISGTEGQVWLLKKFDDVLFCGHNNGTYAVNQDQAKLISNFPGTWDIKDIPNHRDMLLQGNFNGLSVLERINGNWVFKNKIEGFDISSRFLEFIGDTKVAVNREFKGIFELELDNDFSKVVEEKNEASKGTGASLSTYLGNVLYASNNGIFKYNENTQTFIIDTVLTTIFYDNNDNPVGIFIADEQAKRLWSFTNSNIVYASPEKFNSSSKINKIAIPSDVRRNLGVLGFESLTPINNEKYLIGMSNGYLTLDLKKLTSKEYSIRINSISRKSNDSETEKISLNSTTTFNYTQNNLFFSYHVPEFDKYTEVNYQYQLEGIHEQWSDFASVSNVSFENLPYGNYTFNVRARVGNDISTNIASYSFRIERPWYLSNMAILLYVLCFFLSGFFVHRLYKNYYRRQREQLLSNGKKKLKRKKLKAQKKIVQIKNEKLREEVANKNRELAISTMSIIKRNEFLNTIKDQLKKNANNPEVKSVIRTIDRNINNSDDWKFFEDAFNNADKDFLKKVKNLHPELTANDLRLCAYLRLNLSSKEIAPLLNISLRSVEVKRYRLRKKMNLLHKDGLADHIMNI